MKSRNILLYGKQFRTSISPSGTTYESSNIARGRDYLGVTRDVLNGNRKSPNPHQFSKTLERTWQGSRSTSYIPQKTTSVVSGIISSAVASPSQDTSDIAATARSEALEKFYDQLRGTVDLSVDLAQSGQVVKMLKDAVNVKKHILGTLPLLAEFIQPGGKVRLGKAAANAHLQWIYGWKPLISTLHGSIGNLGQTADNMLAIKARATKTKGAAYNGPVPFGKITGGTEDYSARYEVVAEFRPPSGTLQNLALYTSLNPVSIAWELLPYSFVADWFLNIGGYVRMMESAALSQTRFTNGYQTTGTRVIVSATCSVILGNNSIVDIGTANSYSVSSTKNRTVLTAAPYPNFPRFRVDLGSSQLLAAASLLSQGLTGFNPARALR